MSYGIRVSKDGHDVKTCSTKDLSFSSEENTIKIFQSEVLTFEFLGTGKTYITEDSVSITITHNLGYEPFIWGEYLGPNNYWYPINQEYNEDVYDEWGAWTMPMIFFMENITNTQVTFTGWFPYGHGESNKYYLRYYIFIEEFA